MGPKVGVWSPRGTCAGDLRIQHALGELTGASYGRVVAFYTRSRSLLALNEAILEEAVKEKEPKSYLSAQQKKALGAEREAVDPELRRIFEDAFGAWKQTWFSGGLAINSNPHSRAVGKEYDALIALGSAIMPLIVEKLPEPDSLPG